jgi:hypothetical protein
MLSIGAQDADLRILPILTSLEPAWVPKTSSAIRQLAVLSANSMG